MRVVQQALEVDERRVARSGRRSQLKRVFGGRVGGLVTPDRPVCVTVIGWGTIALAVLMVFSGLMALYISASFGDRAFPPGERDLFDFVFDHFGIFAALQAVLGLLLVQAGRSLLRLRRWAANVIQAVAWLFLAYMLLFALAFLREMLAAMPKAPLSSHPMESLAFVSVMAVFTLAFYGVPLTLVIRNLRSDHVRSLLV
jgi:hypothetical protein